MIVHNFNPVLVDLGLFEIRWYSIAYILGIIIGWLYAGKIIKETSQNINNFESIKKTDFGKSIALEIPLENGLMIDTEFEFKISKLLLETKCVKLK